MQSGEERAAKLLLLVFFSKPVFLTFHKRIKGNEYTEELCIGILFYELCIKFLFA